MPEGEQGMNVARIGVLLAGLPDTVAAQTINRFCSSGLQAVALAADRIRLGDADLMLAGGTESMTHGADDGQQGRAERRSVFDNDENVAIAYGMGITAEKVAEAVEGDRAKSRTPSPLASPPEGAARRSRPANSATRSCPTRSSAPQPDLGSGNVMPCAKTAGHRRRPAPRYHARRPREAAHRCSAARGSVTAGNSSQMSDGAAAVVLA